jgi:hypothetical protein
MDHGARLCFFAVTPTRVCLFSVFSFQFSVFSLPVAISPVAISPLAVSWLQAPGSRILSAVYRLPSTVYRLLSSEF